MGYGLMIVGVLSFVGGFIHLFTSKEYLPKLSIMLIFIGILTLPLGATTQDIKNTSVAHKNCISSGGEWLGKREWNLVTKLYTTKYTCYKSKTKD